MNKAKKPPINIGKLERFAADFESVNELRKPKKIKQDLGKVAVVGSGPAGLSVAGDIAKLGYDVTVFEANLNQVAYSYSVFLSSVCPSPLYVVKSPVLKA